MVSSINIADVAVLLVYVEFTDLINWVEQINYH